MGIIISNHNSVFGNLIAKEGHQEELLGYLLDASEGMKKTDDCYCYMVGTNPDEKDAVYVFEVWGNSEAHQTSLLCRLKFNVLVIIWNACSFKNVLNFINN